MNITLNFNPTHLCITVQTNVKRIPRTRFSFLYLLHHSQGRNFNENTGGAEALLSFSYSLTVIDTRKPYNSTITKIFGKIYEYF
jgi:hypothetical protein